GAEAHGARHSRSDRGTGEGRRRRRGRTREGGVGGGEVGQRGEFRVPPPSGPGVPSGERGGEPGEGGGGFGFCFGEGWCDLNLVRLNPCLGEYFGTTEGLLVIKAPADSSLPLKSGDVILSIGGRKPTTVEHAMRILRSYDAGETVSIEIMRKQKRMTLSWKVPAE